MTTMEYTERFKKSIERKAMERVRAGFTEFDPVILDEAYEDLIEDLVSEYAETLDVELVNTKWNTIAFLLSEYFGFTVFEPNYFKTVIMKKLEKEYNTKEQFSFAEIEKEKMIFGNVNEKKLRTYQKRRKEMEKAKEEKLNG